MSADSSMDLAAQHQRWSRRTALDSTAVKILLLAALTPPVVVGLAQRAGELTGSVAEQAQLAALASGLAPLGAVLGVLLLGRASDMAGFARWGRWLWVLAGALLGTAGLLMALGGPGPVFLVAGWATAQAGFSGAIAVTRSIMATTQTTHLRRGSVAMVVGGYAGMFLPIVLLLLWPHYGWQIAVGFALAAVLGAVGCALARKAAPPAPGRVEAPVSPEAPASAAPAAAQDAPSGWASAKPRRWALLATQFCFSAALAAFITYHPLDMALRYPEGTRGASLGTAILGMALLALVLSAAALWRAPRLLARSRGCMILSGLLLSLGLLVRIGFGQLPGLAVSAVLCGAAAGLGACSVLATAMASAPEGRKGTHLGIYSAAGSLGQMAGPAVGLWLMAGAEPGNGAYAPVFAAIACIGVGWPALLCLRSAVIPTAGRQVG